MKKTIIIAVAVAVAVAVAFFGSPVLLADDIESRIDYSGFDVIVPETTPIWGDDIMGVFDIVKDWLGRGSQSDEKLALQALDDYLDREQPGWRETGIADKATFDVAMAKTAKEALWASEGAYAIYTEAWKDARKATREAETVNSPETRDEANYAIAYASRAFIVYSDTLEIARATKAIVRDAK